MEKPVGKPYEGPSGIGRDSTWLTAEDLVEGKDIEVTIEKVVLYPEVTFQGGRKRVNMLGLQFVGKERVLGLNATNRKVLNKALGNITKAWKGQKVTLYISETQLAGETVKCVRIRDRGSRAATAAEEFLHDDEPQPSASAVDPDETAFHTAADVAGLTAKEKEELLADSDGSYQRAHAELAARAKGQT